MRNLLHTLCAAFLLVTGSSAFASVSENFEQIPNNPNSIRDILISQNWQFPDFDVNPEGVFPIQGLQTMGSGPANLPTQYSGIVTPYFDFSATETVTFKYKIHRTFMVGCRRWLLVKLIDGAGAVTQIDSVEISRTPVLVNYSKTINMPGTYAIYINIKGDGCDSKLGVDEFTFTGNVSSLNYPAPVNKEEQATGINTIKDATDIALYPNPAASQLNLNVSSESNQNSAVEVYNINGEKMISQNTTVHSGTNIVIVNVADLIAGNYFVSIRTSEGVLTKRFMKL